MNVLSPLDVTSTVTIVHENCAPTQVSAESVECFTVVDPDSRQYEAAFFKTVCRCGSQVVEFVTDTNRENLTNAGVTNGRVISDPREIIG